MYRRHFEPTVIEVSADDANFDISQFNYATFIGYITVISTATGEHRTFRFKKNKADADFAPGRTVVSLLTGCDNERSYTGFAFADADGVVWRSRMGETYPKLARMLVKLAGHVAAGHVVAKLSRRCDCCCRRLTTKESLEVRQNEQGEPIGYYGPVCWNRLQKLATV